MPKPSAEPLPQAAAVEAQLQQFVSDYTQRATDGDKRAQALVDRFEALAEQLAQVRIAADPCSKESKPCGWTSAVTWNR